MRHLYIALIVLVAFNSFTTQKLKVDNTKPLYGEFKKSKEHKKIDDEFIKTCLKQFGSIDSSVKVQIDYAWRYYYNNDLKTAMKRFNQAWLLNPEYPDSYFGFASLLETEGQINESKRFYKIALEKDIQNNKAEKCYQKIAKCKEQLKDFEGVIAAYIKITTLNPTNSFAFKKLGYFQMHLGYLNQAINAYDKAIELDPKDAVTHNNKGYLNQTLKNNQKAINDYSKAIELNPNYISALVNRGITEIQINQFKKAKSDFQRCILLDPKSGELRKFLALSELGLNENLNACENLKLALKLGDQTAIQLINKNCKK